MTTVIVMLILMMVPYAVAQVRTAVTHREVDLRASGAIGLTILFIFTGIGHFIETEAMSQMLPPWVPARVLLIYATGILEFAISAGFFLRKHRRMTGWLAAAMLVLFFPANIYAAMNHIPMGGHASGPIYLLVRAPLQAIIVLWIYWFTIRRPASALRVSS